MGDAETAFVVDEVSMIIKESVENSIGVNAYQHNKVNGWTSSIVEQSLKKLTGLGKPFKYIVSVVILQKTGAGLHTASSCYWDNTTDGAVQCGGRTRRCTSLLACLVWEFEVPPPGL